MQIKNFHFFGNASLLRSNRLHLTSVSASPVFSVSVSELVGLKPLKLSPQISQPLQKLLQLLVPGMFDKFLRLQCFGNKPVCDVEISTIQGDHSDTSPGDLRV